ncbi:MAG: hypothetical protein AAF351_12180 [Pseudomonadota bacterium]
MTKPTAREVLLYSDVERSVEQIDAMEAQFFNQVVLRNGTHKTTSTKRLTEIDNMLVDLIQSSGVANSGPIRVVDMGVSSGVTTAELVQSLNDNGVTHKLDAFDLCVDASIVSYSPQFHVLEDSNGWPLQFEFFGRSEENTLGVTLFRKLKRVLPIFTLRVLRGLFALIVRRPERRDVKLISKHLRDVENVNIFEYDLANINQLDKKYDVVRAANILNRAYFDDEFLSQSVAKIRGVMVEDGLFCVVRTHEAGVNHGAIYRLTNGQFVEQTIFGDGSEIDFLIRPANS